MTQPINIRKIRVPQDLTGAYVYNEDVQGNAQELGTILQRGLYTLAANKAFVSLPRALVSAASAANIAFLVTSKTANQQFVESVAAASAFGSVNVSTISGFTVSGSGTDTGYWCAIGYR